MGSWYVLEEEFVRRWVSQLIPLPQTRPRTAILLLLLYVYARFASSIVDMSLCFKLACKNLPLNATNSRYYALHSYKGR